MKLKADVLVFIYKSSTTFNSIIPSERYATELPICIMNRCVLLFCSRWRSRRLSRCHQRPCTAGPPEPAG